MNAHDGQINLIECMLVVAFILGAGFFAATRKRYERVDYRVLDLEMLATKLGFESFKPNRDEGFPMGWGFLSRLAQGENRYAFNILRGTYQDQTLFIFDYHYQIGGTSKDVEHHFCTMFMLIAKESCFPKITIRPERSDTFLSKMDAALDEHDVKFESVEFSKAFRVLCADKKFAYDVCNPQMMEFLLANRDLDVEIQGPVILLAFTPQMSVDRIEFNLQRLAQIRSLLPQYLFTNK
jgi:hypothetical protein